MLRLTLCEFTFTSPGSAKNPKFRTLYESTIAFRNEQYQWHQVCEATYDNYMIRRIRA
jgi:TRAP-type mannitol/chloroaromatic compound transport system substrate-binding protein